jgi:KDO2-lipid IV(A) lauroyltransferase
VSKPAIQRILELLAYFPLRFQYRLGDVVAFIFRCIPNRYTRLMRQQIKLCLPELDRAAQKQLYRQALRHTVYTLTELGAVWCWPADKILGRVTAVDICEEFHQANGGKIILAPHLGSWETLGIWLGQNCDAIILYKRPRDKALDGFVRQVRGRTGGTPVPTKKRGLRKLLIGLREGNNLMILPDQKPGARKACIESEIFGVNAPTTTLVNNLCGKVDCGVFIATIYRSSPPGEFSLTIQLLDRERLAKDEIASAQYMNDKIEQIIRQSPEQYQWAYRRFSSKAYEPDK